MENVGSSYNSDGWNAFFIIFIVFSSMVLIANIVTFCIAYNEQSMSAYSLRYYIPLCTFYAILNIFIHLAVLCLIITIGSPGVGLIVGGIVYIILLIGTSVDKASGSDNYATGYFHLMGWIAQFADALGNERKKQISYKLQYTKFLNTEY
jgi:hypothetical protein